MLKDSLLSYTTSSTFLDFVRDISRKIFRMQKKWIFDYLNHFKAKKKIRLKACSTCIGLRIMNKTPISIKVTFLIQS